MLLIVFFEVLDLFHNLTENFGAILRRIAVLNKANLDIKLQLITDNLIVQPVCKRRFGINDFFNLLCHFGTKLEKRKENYSKELYSFMYFIIPLICNLIYPLAIFKALGKDVKIEVIIPAFVSVVMVILGNYLPKCKQNSTMGIKIPWTLKSEENWNKTHRFAGWLWTVCGILIMLTGFFGGVWVFLPIVLVMVLVPFLYSYLLHRRGL